MDIESLREITTSGDKWNWEVLVIVSNVASGISLVGEKLGKFEESMSDLFTGLFQEGIFLSKDDEISTKDIGNIRIDNIVTELSLDEDDVQYMFYIVVYVNVVRAGTDYVIDGSGRAFKHVEGS